LQSLSTPRTDPGDREEHDSHQSRHGTDRQYQLEPAQVWYQPWRRDSRVTLQHGTRITDYGSGLQLVTGCRVAVGAIDSPVTGCYSSDLAKVRGEKLVKGLEGRPCFSGRARQGSD
jgi:hypothetical protein